LSGFAEEMVTSKDMADPFELWRLMWSTAVSSGLEQLAEAVPGAATAARRRAADAIDLSTFPTLGRVRIQLATMLLLEQREASRAKVPPLVIVAPYAVHDASIADFAPGHSLAQTLAEADAGSVALTFWKSATAEMRDYGIDAYLARLMQRFEDFAVAGVVFWAISLDFPWAWTRRLGSGLEPEFGAGRVCGLKGRL